MKILFVNHTGKVSGAERVLLAIAERLHAFTLRLLSPAGDLLEGALARGIECSVMDQVTARFTWRPDRLIAHLNSFRKAILQIHRAVKAWKPDLIHANTVRAGIAATVATAGMPVKVVWHVHDILPRHPLSSLIRLLFLFSGRSYAICVSNATARRFRGAVLQFGDARRRIFVLHNGIDPARYCPDSVANLPEERSGLRAELGLPASAFVMAIVGQFTPRKGQLELVNAFPQVLSCIPSAALLVVGTPLFNQDWEYHARVRQAIEKNGLTGKIVLAGQRNDMPAVLRSIDALVVNSAEEPFGMVLLEAMACGRPVVSANVGGVPEIIHDRRNGLLYEPRDYARLARHLADLAENPALSRTVGEHARETVATRFTIPIQVAQLVDIYRRVVGEIAVSAAAVPQTIGEKA
jgi:L-malate glycosyltransferase